MTNGLSKWNVFVNTILKISGQHKDKKVEKRDTIRSFTSKVCLQILKVAEFFRKFRPAWNY
jgi:hypothetical protein